MQATFQILFVCLLLTDCSVFRVAQSLHLEIHLVSQVINSAENYLIMIMSQKGEKICNFGF